MYVVTLFEYILWQLVEYSNRWTADISLYWRKSYPRVCAAYFAAMYSYHEQML